MFTFIDTFVENILQGLGVWGPIVGCFFIIIESIFPILPLFVFITLNFLAFGNIIGFIISWVFTCLGCSLSFFLMRKKVQTHLFRHLNAKGLISQESINNIDKLKLEQLTMIIAVPFTPAFLVNIIAGLSKMSYKKYLTALLVGKIFLVYFWGFVGVGLIESIKNPIYLVKILVLVIIAFIISKLIAKRFKIN